MSYSPYPDTRYRQVPVLIQIPSQAHTGIMLFSDPSPSYILKMATIMLLCVAPLAYLMYRRVVHTPIPVSVNYHLTRRCNKECGFCFHTAKTSNTATLEDAQRALALLKCAGMRKVNFAGGEPFLNAKFLGMELSSLCAVIWEGD